MDFKSFIELVIKNISASLRVNNMGPKSTRLTELQPAWRKRLTDVPVAGRPSTRHLLFNKCEQLAQRLQVQLTVIKSSSERALYYCYFELMAHRILISEHPGELEKIQGETLFEQTLK